MAKHHKHTLKTDGRPSLQWYPNDPLNDVGLKLCPLDAQGLWYNMLWHMFFSPTRGALLQPNGDVIGSKELAELTGKPEATVKQCLSILEHKQVFSMLEDGTIYNRRMRRDEKLRQSKVEAGAKGGRGNRQAEGQAEPQAKEGSSSSTSSSVSSSTSKNYDTGHRSPDDTAVKKEPNNLAESCGRTAGACEITAGQCAKGKEKKGKEHEPEIIEIIAYLNESFGTKYGGTSKATISQISARLSDGFTVENFKVVIDLKGKQWKTDEKMSRYLRPKTLFSDTNFESYLNEVKPAKGKTKMFCTVCSKLTTAEAAKCKKCGGTGEVWI